MADVGSLVGNGTTNVGSSVFAVNAATSSNDQATNGTTEFVHTNGLALPANFLTAGKILRLTVPITIVSGSAPSTYQIKVRLDGVPLFTSSAVEPVAANQAGLYYDLVFRMTTLTAGAAGTVDTRMASYLSSSNSVIDNNLLAQPVTIDTTTVHTLQISTKWSAVFSGTGANSISVVRPFLEALN